MLNVAIVPCQIFHHLGLYFYFKGHGHWVNSLALSTEYTLRTGAFDHTCKQYSSPEEMKEVICRFSLIISVLLSLKFFVY